MASLAELQTMCDALLPYLTSPPALHPTDQRAYLAQSLEFTYTAVELVEAQLERSLRAAQDGLAAAITESEILEMEKKLVEEQGKMDEMKASCRAETKRILDTPHHRSNSLKGSKKQDKVKKTRRTSLNVLFS